MWQRLLDYLFPRRSLTGREGEWVTPEERRLMGTHPVVLETHVLRSQGWRSIDRIVAAAEFRASPLLRHAIHLLKYRRIPELRKELGEILAAASPSLLLRDRPTVCPVPLHWTRRFKRGFNQSELLAREVADKLHLPYADLLRRTRSTGSQVGRRREERLTAVVGAFRAAQSVPDSIILVDDLATTGATLDACAQALKHAGAKRVQGFVLAHG